MSCFSAQDWIYSACLEHPTGSNPFLWPLWNKITHTGCGFFPICMNRNTIWLCNSPKLKERHTTVQRSDGKGEAGSHALKRCWVHASVSCTCFFQASINLLFLSMQKLPHLAKKKNDKFCLSWTEPSGFTRLKSNFSFISSKDLLVVAIYSILMVFTKLHFGSHYFLKQWALLNTTISDNRLIKLVSGFLSLAPTFCFNNCLSVLLKF